MSVTFQGRQNTLIGVISDTHGVLLPQALKALESVDLIIHAGDVGSPEVIERLQAIAPVKAVRGNMDFLEGLQDLPETEAVEVGALLLYVIHDLHKLDIAPLEAGFAAVIFGHTHRPSAKENNGVLFINPGSAAQPRHDSPASLALLRVRGNSLSARFVDLDEPAAD